MTTAHKRIQTENQLFQDRFNSCLDTAKRNISKNAADPVKKYGFTKRKRIRGDKTLKVYNFGPKVVYFGHTTVKMAGGMSADGSGDCNATDFQDG